MVIDGQSINIDDICQECRNFFRLKRFKVQTQEFPLLETLQIPRIYLNILFEILSLSYSNPGYFRLGFSLPDVVLPGHLEQSGRPFFSASAKVIVVRVAKTFGSFVRRLQPLT